MAAHGNQKAHLRAIYMDSHTFWEPDDLEAIRCSDKIWRQVDGACNHHDRDANKRIEAASAGSALFGFSFRYAYPFEILVTQKIKIIE